MERPKTPPLHASILAEAYAAFEAGRFDAAIAGFTEAISEGQVDADLSAALGLMRSAGQEIGLVVQAIDDLIDQFGSDLPADVRLEAERSRFELIDPAGADPDRRASAALAVLAAANEVAERAWRELLTTGAIAEIERACWRPAQLLEALEHQTYAPMETGLPAAALQRITEFGIASAADYVLAREAERLLHAAGDREAAYRVEAARRPFRTRATAESTTSDPETSLRGVVIAIAGGHISLRQRARADLTRGKHGAAEVREIPSRMEANRGMRDIAGTLQGCDVAVLLIRYLAHSTADQVKAVAARTGTAVEIAESLSAGSVRRAVERWAERRGPTGAGGEAGR